MGKILSVASKKIKRFNVENRAHKVISKEKPVVAPKHPSSLREIDMLMKEHGGTFEEMKLKHSQLDENLKKVYVTSTMEDMNKFGKPSDRTRLPVNRLSSKDSELGYEEPSIIPRGKITLKQALRVLTDKQESKEINAEKIASSLNIPLQDAENLVNYFSSLKIYMPEKVPELGIPQKAKKILLKQLSSTKVESVVAEPSRLRLEDSSRNKPD